MMMNSQRWQQLMRSLQLQGNEDTCTALILAYSESHRHYHTCEHIHASLKHLDATRSLAENSDAIELALWFHDAVYQPYAADNERKSADWAMRFLQANACQQSLVDGVDDLIMVTMHNEEPKTSDQQLILDIDLAILGAPAVVYDQFESNVRKEYRWVPFFLYRKKRKQILYSFLNREHIYHQPFFASKFEDQARHNLNRAIKNL
ncbi:N-methyl-D-aspartate receptor NMDAR2C subunit [Marinicella sp. W31]|uniref:HD domain-containing protein n=1 Tax=Marinicella sp. W31 TaxID=3023713 RepID=UPI003756716F